MVTLRWWNTSSWTALGEKTLLKCPSICVFKEWTTLGASRNWWFYPSVLGPLCGSQRWCAGLTRITPCQLQCLGQRRWDSCLWSSYLTTSPIMAIIISRNRIISLLCIKNSRGCVLLACSPLVGDEEIASFSPTVWAKPYYWCVWTGIKAQLGNSDKLF